MPKKKGTIFSCAQFYWPFRDCSELTLARAFVSSLWEIDFWSENKKKKKLEIYWFFGTTPCYGVELKVILSSDFPHFRVWTRTCSSIHVASSSPPIHYCMTKRDAHEHVAFVDKQIKVKRKKNWMKHATSPLQLTVTSHPSRPAHTRARDSTDCCEIRSTSVTSRISTSQFFLVEFCFLSISIRRIITHRRPTFTRGN